MIYNAYFEMATAVMLFNHSIFLEEKSAGTEQQIIFKCVDSACYRDMSERSTVLL